MFSLRLWMAEWAMNTLIAPPMRPMTQMLAKLPGQERPRGVGGRREAAALRALASSPFAMAVVARSGNCCSIRKPNEGAAMCTARCARARQPRVPLVMGRRGPGYQVGARKVICSLF